VQCTSDRNREIKQNMKRKKEIISTIILAIGIFVASSLPVNAGTKVMQINDDTLKVIIMNAKPPHKRFMVKKSIDASLYERYCQRLVECTSSKLIMTPSHK